jgi:glycosyltransferase involved in cell wall biosynthesis
MNQAKLLRVAVLVDLLRSPQAGGHVKCWERLAEGAAAADLPLDLTVYFSGRADDEVLGPRTRFRHLPQVFSTANLAFLPYVPDHTDLAPWHPGLARALAGYDLIHTTDGFFAFARTAARVSHARGIPLVTSIHTDTPAYARIFTRNTIEKMFGTGWLGRKMLDDWKWPERQQRAMERKLDAHLRQCRAALATRAEDQAIAEKMLGPARVHHMRRGVDKDMFGPHKRDRAGIERDYGIAAGRIVILFVGRVDIGKNIYTLLASCEKLIAEGHPLHLVVAGVGPAADDVKKRLGAHASTPGFVPPAELARLYASVDMLAVPSEVETASMVAVEAIASDCPAFIAKKSGVAALFDTPAVVTVESGSAAWADAVRDFASDAAKRQALRDAANAHGRAHLSGWREVLAEDFYPVWRDAAKRETVFAAAPAAKIKAGRAA